MKALVTGASGFIGSTLIEDLNSAGIHVHALMRSSSSVTNLGSCRFEPVQGDLRDIESLKRAVRDVDYVFHLAGVTSAPNRDGFFEHNAGGTERLARAVAETCPNLKRFVYVSSLAAAGPAFSLEPRVESEAEKPVSFYGESKLQGEKELLRFKDSFPVVIVRPPMVYGPKDKGVFVAIKTVSRNVMPLLPGSSPDGHKYYSSVHVKDLVQGIMLAGQAPLEKVPSGEIFYISADGFHTYQELLKTIAGHLELKRPFQFRVPKLALTAAAAGLAAASVITRKSYPLNIDKLNEIFPDYWICSNEKAKSLLQFTPRFDLSTGMADAIEWYKRERWI